MKWLKPAGCIVLAAFLTACSGPTPTLQFTATPGNYPPPVATLPSPTTGAYPGPAAQLPSATPVVYPGPATDLPGGAATPTLPLPTATQPASAATATPTAGSAVMTYQDFEIVPAEASLPVGTTVLFLIRSNSGAFHQPYSITAPNVFEAPANLGDGTTYQFTFAEAGTTTILCGYHPNMQATLTVTP